MAGQWEVVGKKKEKCGKNIKNVTSTAKKPENIKVEEVLAKSQVKNLYANGKSKEKVVEPKKGLDVGAKKIQKKQEKAAEPAKPKPPKSIESALNQIDFEEFANILEKSKTQFPDAPIVWLKELAHFLNQKVNIDVQDPVFSTKPQRYPLAVLPSGIKAVIENAIQDTNTSNIQLFFDISLTSMATDMSKNLPALGLKILLQYIAIKNPSLVSANLAKHCVLRNSYQNRPNIGLSILWAVGQAGLADFQIGLKVFQELMLPLSELKNYSRYVVKYLIDLISKANTSSASLTKEQYITILTILLNKKNASNESKQDLSSVTPCLKLLLLSGNEKNTSLEFLLQKIATSDNKAFQECICDVIVDSFGNEANLDSWVKIYLKNIPSSADLLQFLERNWKSVSSKVNKNKLRETLDQIVTASSELLLKKKKDEGVSKCSEISKVSI